MIAGAGRMPEVGMTDLISTKREGELNRHLSAL